MLHKNKLKNIKLNKDITLFIHPIYDDHIVIMIVFKNGSRSREYVKDNATETKSWKEFSDILDNKTKPLNNNILYSILFDPEITPSTLNNGIHIFDINKNICKFKKIDNKKLDINCVRGVIEFRFLSILYHIQKSGFILKNLNNIILTGGAANNDSIKQICANIFGNDIISSKLLTNSASFGSSLRCLNSLNIDYDYNKIINNNDKLFITKTNKDIHLKYINELLPKMEYFENEFIIKELN